MKKYLSSPPLLSLSKPREELYLYIAVSQVAVNAALVRKEEGAQRPVYFISRGILKGRREVPPNGEVSLHTSNGSTKAQVVLTSPYHHSLDGPALEKGHEQP